MLELKHISKTYKTSKGVETKALKDVNLVFPKRGMVFVLGKSGSGKSTLLNIVGGLDQASEGEIIIHQKSSKDFSQADYDSYRNTYVGFIFQEFNLMDDYTIEKNIALALQLQQVDVKHEVIDSLLTRLGLEGYGHRYPNELSGGQKQRVAIARALVKDPQILMADEPTGALDSITGKEIFETLKELSKEKLVIVVSHDRDSAQQYADRIIEFKDGVVDSDTNPDVVVQQDEFNAIKSHLPFKDSFKLGFSCLAHKKIRMVFTILLTSFALLTLGISDAVGDFNGANAQQKAMNEMNEKLVGIQKQLVDKDGNVLESWTEERFELQEEEITGILSNHTNKKFARVYDSQSLSYTMDSMGINIMTSNAYNQAIREFYITEMDAFDDLSLSNVSGAYPSNFDEVAISSYLADIMISEGISDEENKTQYPKSNEDLIGKMKVKVQGKWLTISGIVNYDLSAYESLKENELQQMNAEEYNLYSQFSNVVNMNGNKLYTKTGFVDSLELSKGETLSSEYGGLSLVDETTNGYLSSMSYLVEDLSYYNGSEMVSTHELKDDEVIIDIFSVIQLLGSSGANLDSDQFQSKSNEDKRDYVLNILDNVIGKTYQLQYQSFYIYEENLIDQKVKVIGVILPEDYSSGSLFEMNMNYCSKSLLEPHILEPLYIGEVLTSSEGNERLALLQEYTVNDELFTHTFVSKDVKLIQGFANFATQVFLYASIMFFIFAAVLMMNFIIVSIAYRKKDIGILRAIGARRSDILKIFVWEGITLAVISYVVTLLGLQVISNLVNDFAKESIGVMISPIILTLRQPLVLFIMVIVVTMVACFLPSLRIANQKPIDAIKK